VHYVVPAGGLNRKKNRWKKSTRNFLVRVEALSRLFRGKFLALLIEQGFTFPRKVTKIDWTVHCEPAGTGEKALEYLSRYLYRGALSEKQIISDHEGQVTFSYVESKTGERKTRTLPGLQFLRLLLTLVLPKGFRRARDYGFLHGRAKKTLAYLQLMLRVKIRPKTEVPRPSLRCPQCGQSMQIIGYRLHHRSVAIRGPPQAGSP
jgi:hypothetical protein